LIISLLLIWIWAIYVAILCLMLVSVTTSACKKYNEEKIVKSLNKSEQDLKESLLFLIKEWKENN